MVKMGTQEPSDAVSLAEPAIFVPPFNPRYAATGTAKQRSVSSGNYLDSEDFERKGLLLMQDEKGSCWWTWFENLFEQDRKITPLPGALSPSQVDCIVKERILFIADGDLRLSDFGLLSQYSKPPTIDEALGEFDLAARHLASTRKVHIFTVDADGKRTCDETKTADYYRAKADIRRNPADTRNMRRFCNRQWNGEGPSTRDSRICPGYVPPSARWPPPATGGPQDTPLSACSRPSQDSSSSSTTSSDEPHRRPQTPTAPESSRDTKRSLVYYLMRLALVPSAKIDARLRKHDLRRARREKRPQRVCSARSRWSAVLTPLRNLVAGARGVTGRHGEQPAVGEQEEADQEDEDEDEDENEKESPHGYLPGAMPRNRSHDHSASPPLHIIREGPLGAGENSNVGTEAAAETAALAGSTAAETLVGVPVEGHALLLLPRPKKDSLGEAITNGACESKAAFADPGVSTMAGSEDIQRNWNGNGGWKWIFDEGLG